MFLIVGAWTRRHHRPLPAMAFTETARVGVGHCMSRCIGVAAYVERPTSATRHREKNDVDNSPHLDRRRHGAAQNASARTPAAFVWSRMGTAAAQYQLSCRTQGAVCSNAAHVLSERGRISLCMPLGTAQAEERQSGNRRLCRCGIGCACGTGARRARRSADAAACATRVQSQADSCRRCVRGQWRGRARMDRAVVVSFPARNTRHRRRRSRES